MDSRFRAKCVLVTGGAGFIGSHLVKELVRREAKVCVLEDANTYSWRLKDCTENIIIKRLGSWQCSDLRNVLRSIKPDIVFHLRAKIIRNFGDADSGALFKVNFEQTKNILTAVESARVQILIHIGTTAEYGCSLGPIRESDSPKPDSLYGESKLAATFWLENLIRRYNFPAVILRLAVVYGPYQKPHDYLIPNVIKQCLLGEDFHIPSSAFQKRAPLFIDDTIRGLLKAAQEERANGEVINLGSDQGHTVLEIANIINEKLGQPINIITDGYVQPPEQANHCWPDITKAKRILSWVPEIPLDEGIVRTSNWYKNNLNVLGVS